MNIITTITTAKINNKNFKDFIWFLKQGQKIHSVTVIFLLVSFLPLFLKLLATYFILKNSIPFMLKYSHLCFNTFAFWQ